MTGPCDTTGCKNDATVHHGLEEFYCQPCEDANRLRAKVTAQQKRFSSLHRMKEKFEEAGRQDAALRTQVRMSEVVTALFILYREEIDAYEKRWPEHCKTCRGWGVFTFYENHGMPGGMSETITDPCEPCYGKCPRCAVEIGHIDTFHYDEEGCRECGWAWGKNPGDAIADVSEEPV